jgi:AcrR family transcriptional regulator
VVQVSEPEEKSSRRRGTELEAAILDAAWGVLETSGWGGFTFDGVAERAHTSKPVLYRRWRTREDLLRATVRRRGEISPSVVPDTGSLRGDTIALLTRANGLRGSMAAVLSMRLGAIFEDLSLTPAELRQELLGDRESVMDVIVTRAAERGELGPKTPSARVVSLPFDLFRHEVLMTLAPVPADTIAGIVDDVFLPLVRAASGLDAVR